jgi:hypothetical protein
MPSTICFSLNDLLRLFVRLPAAAGAPADAMRRGPTAPAMQPRPGPRATRTPPFVFPMF